MVRQVVTRAKLSEVHAEFQFGEGKYILQGFIKTDFSRTFISKLSIKTNKNLKEVLIKKTMLTVP